MRQLGQDVSREFLKVGYGQTGYGSTGAVQGTEGTRHHGENRYDTLGSSIGLKNGEKQLVYDFDNGQTKNDALGHYGVVHNTGLGDREANAAPGDSGGPSFVDGYIAGVTSYGSGFAEEPDISPGTDRSFGEISVDTRIAAFADWIDDIIQSPRMLVDGVHGRPAITNARHVDVSFTNLPATVTGVRFAVNNFNYPSEIRPLSDVMTIPIPSYRGVNYVNAELLFEDGTTKHLYQRVVHATPNMKINGGSTTTNLRDVTVSFPDVSSDATQVQILVNGQLYTDWEALEHEHHVRLNFRGTNYLRANLKYVDGHQRTVYADIELADPTLSVNDGASLTNTGTLHVTIEQLAEDAQQVYFRINGKPLSTTFPVADNNGSATFELQKLTYIGRNYIEADIVYENEDVRTLYGSIDYVKPTLVLNGGVESTTSRDITATLTKVAPDVMEMRMQINGGEVKSLGDVQSSFGFTLPSWYGTNYVVVELEYDDSRIHKLYAKIGCSLLKASNYAAILVC